MLKSWVNGVNTEFISVTNRGLAYGDGFFTTALLQNGFVYLYGYHLQRIRLSAEKLGLSIDVEDFKQLLALFLQESKKDLPDQKLLLKIIITRSASGRGYFGGESQSVDIVFQIFPYPFSEKKMQSCRENGVRTFVCDNRLSNNKSLAGIKHLNRLEQVLARSEKNPEDCPEGLMLDQHGFLIEGCSSNIFLRKVNKIFTPLLDQAGVAGVMRAHLIDLIKASDFNFSELRLQLDDLLSADEIVFTNSQIGMWPVNSIVDTDWKPDVDERFSIRRHFSLSKVAF